MFEHCKINLLEIKSMLKNIGDTNYSLPSVLLSGATIGQHVRHILEFYQCLLAAEQTGTVNYDKRKRNLQLETDTDFAQQQIEEIIHSLTKINLIQPIKLEGNYTHVKDANTSISSTFWRELVYCLEHSIHHQALIKIGLKELNLEQLISENFGVAPATIRYKQEQCVQ
jgi:uncharacterized damage-inducible protein DinB